MTMNPAERYIVEILKPKLPELQHLINDDVIRAHFLHTLMHPLSCVDRYYQAMNNDNTQYFTVFIPKTLDKTIHPITQQELCLAVQGHERDKFSGTRQIQIYSLRKMAQTINGSQVNIFFNPNSFSPSNRPALLEIITAVTQIAEAGYDAAEAYFNTPPAPSNTQTSASASTQGASFSP